MAYIKPKNPAAFVIKKQTIRVEKLVGQRNKFRSVAFNQERKLKEDNDRREREESLEKYEDSGGNLNNIKGFSTPRLGFLDSIKNFLFTVLFGSLALKLLPYLPQLKGLLITTLKVGNFAVDFAGTILNAMVTFIDKVYGIIDFGKQQAKILGGEAGVKKYEETLGLMNKVMNSMFIAGMLFSDLIVIKAQADASQSAVNDIGTAVGEEIVKRQGFRATIQALGQKIGVLARGVGVVALVGLASSLLGELTFQQRKFTKKLENDIAYQLKEANLDPNPITRALKLVAYNAALPGLKFFNFVSTGVGTLLDIIGAPFRYAGELLNLGIMSLTGDADGIRRQRENLEKLDARIREQIREIVNTLSLGTLAKEKGSFGSLYGSRATKAMGYASGGAVAREGEEAIGSGGITRTGGLKTISRTIEIPMSPLSPGAGSGGDAPYVDPGTGKLNGKTNIETFFPNPEAANYVSPYRYLSNSYTIASSGTFLKPFMQMPIKLIMGNNPSEGDYNSLAAAVNNLFNYMLGNTKIRNTKKSLLDEIGPVDIQSWVRNSIKDTMIDSVNSLLESIKEQFGKKSSHGDGTGNPSAQKGEDAGTNPLAQFGGEAQFVIGDSIAHGFAGRSGTGSEASDTFVGRGAAAVLSILKSKGDALKGMLIDLSTGIANSLGDYASVEAQLSYLKSMGARVRVLGVAHPFSKKNGGINEKLDQLVKKYGFYFYGGYKGAADGLHGTATDYNELKDRAKRNTAQMDQNISGPTSSLVPSGGLKGLTDADFNELAYIVSGEAGPGDDVYGVAANVLTRVASPAWPNTIRSVGRQSGQYEAVYKGLARYDAKLAKQLKNNQGKIASALIKLDGRESFKGQSQLGSRGAGDPMFDPLGNFYHYASQEKKKDPPPKNPDQSWKKWITAAEEGGLINKTEYVLTHPGEYIVDADSTNLFGVNFYDIINQTEIIHQRRNAAESLISILSQYTEDGFPETEDDYTYRVSTPEVVTIPGPVVKIGSSGFGGGGGGGSDPSLDGTELH